MHTGKPKQRHLRVLPKEVLEKYIGLSCQIKHLRVHTAIFYDSRTPMDLDFPFEILGVHEQKTQQGDTVPVLLVRLQTVPNLVFRVNVANVSIKRIKNDPLVTKHYDTNN